jgi:hypothetical protein
MEANGSDAARMKFFEHLVGDRFVDQGNAAIASF